MHKLVLHYMYTTLNTIVPLHSVGEHVEAKYVWEKEIINYIQKDWNNVISLNRHFKCVNSIETWHNKEHIPTQWMTAEELTADDIFDDETLVDKLLLPPESAFTKRSEWTTYVLLTKAMLKDFPEFFE